MKRFLLIISLFCVAALLFMSDCEGAIHGSNTMSIDLTNAEELKTKALWFPPKKLSVAKEGLGWDGDAASSCDGWVQTKPLALGLSWRPTFVASILVEIQPLPSEITLGDGSRMRPHGGDVYVRYSADKKHWSSWQVLRYTQRLDNQKKQTNMCFEGTIRVPYREREEYGKLLSEYSRLDVPWKSDEEAAVQWILDRDPGFFLRHIPFLGYVEFLFETSFHGGRRIKSFKADVSYGIGGIHSAPKDEAVYKDRNNKPWRFEAVDKESEKDRITD